jgi:hypothetical protein
MPAIWTDPKTWQLDDIYDATEMNEQMRDNLLYLYNRPTSFKRVTYGTATDQYPVASGWQPLTAFDLTITTESGRLQYEFNMPLLPSTAAARVVNLDVYFVEANVWLSSGTSTQYADGALSVRTSTNTIGLNPTVKGIVEIPAGTYTCRLYIKSSAIGVNTIINIMYMPMVRAI